jgi:protein subunit release factor A
MIHCQLVISHMSNTFIHQINTHHIHQYTHQCTHINIILKQYSTLSDELEGATELFQEAGDDQEMREMARGEIKEIEARMDELQDEIQILLLPKDPNDDRNVMIEIRAGTGGSEANIFAGEYSCLFRCFDVFLDLIPFFFSPPRFYANIL